MSVDPAYNYFREAFSEWIAAMEINGKAAQKEIADLLEINKSTAHRYVKGTRNIPFEKQVQIANGSGKNYLDFLIYGKQLFMQEPICKAGLPKDPIPPTQKQGVIETKNQGDKDLKSIVEMIQREKKELKKEWKEERAELKAEWKEEKAELKAEIAELKAENRKLVSQLAQSRRLQTQPVQPPEEGKGAVND